MQRFKAAGLLGCLNDTDVTSENYKHTMKIDWKFIEDQPPLHIGLDCLVCTVNYDIFTAEFHSDPEGWYDDGGLQIYDVVAYLYLKDLPRPIRTMITNDEFVGRILT